MSGRRLYLGIVAALLLTHALVLSATRAPVIASDLLIDASAMLAAVVCLQRSRLGSSVARWKWMLIACSILCWCIGQTIITYDEGFLKVQQAPTAITSDFYFFLFGIPLLLVISFTSDRSRTPASLWIDGLQAALSIYLVHLHLFPGSGGSAAEQAISSLRMTHAYNAENFALAVAAVLRLVARPEGEDKPLYRSLAAFLWTYAIAAAILNHYSSVDGIPTGTFLDLGWDMPFLGFALLVAYLPHGEEAASPNQSWIGLMVTNASSIFFTLALLTMGVYVARTNFVMGQASIVFALVSYGVRSSLIQTQCMRTERKLIQSEGQLLQVNQRLEQLSFADELTGIPNRRKFEETLAAEWNRAQRTGLPLSLLVIDIDHFKLLNDRYGHLHGDNCLAQTARELSRCARRSGDLLARFGGEEFVALLPAITENEAFAIAEHMRTMIEKLTIANEDAPGKRMTISIGIATEIDGRTIEPSELFAHADRALYLAKSRGRNRVCAHVYEDEVKQDVTTCRLVNSEA